MASISLGESRWRMVRRVLKKKKFKYDDARNMTRHDQTHFDWLIEYEFFAAAGDGWYTVEERAKEAADLGFYQI